MISFASSCSLHLRPKCTLNTLISNIFLSLKISGYHRSAYEYFCVQDVTSRILRRFGISYHLHHQVTM
jgi:hypothetical protein